MIIDAHIHFGDDDPDLTALMAEFGLKFLNFCVAQDDHGQWRNQANLHDELARSLPDRYVWRTSFDLPRFDDPHYVDKVIAGLDRDLAAGAVACRA